MTEIITCTGYGFTGSSAATNILEEFENIESLNAEFECTFLHEPDGIQDLENALREGHRLKCDLAIKRFLRLANTLNKQRPFRKYFNNNFVRHSEAFIDSICTAHWNGNWHRGSDTIKLSSNAEKVSTPGKKQVWRITSREKGKSEGDYITYDGVDVSDMTEIKMFHPTYTYIKKTVRNFDAVPLLVDIFKAGTLVYNLPSLTEIQAYARKEFDKLWDEYKRVLNPQHYPVDLARDIWQDKMDLIDKMRKEALGEGEEE